MKPGIEKPVLRISCCKFGR